MAVCLAFVIGLTVGICWHQRDAEASHRDLSIRLNEAQQELFTANVALTESDARIHRLQKERNAFHAERNEVQVLLDFARGELADCLLCLKSDLPLEPTPDDPVPAPAPGPMTEVVEIVPAPKQVPVRCDCGCGKFDCKCACRKSK